MSSLWSLVLGPAFLVFPRSAASGIRGRRCADRQELTQEELAHRSGISAVFMSDIERGVENVTLETIAKLAKGLGVKLGELLVRAGT